MESADDRIAPRLFAVAPDAVRYVARVRGGKLVEMAQSPRFPTANPSESDRYEELLVNPTILELARRRGDLDLGGIRWVVVRYEPFYQALFPFPDGHVSVALELSADVPRLALTLWETLRALGEDSW